MYLLMKYLVLSSEMGAIINSRFTDEKTGAEKENKVSREHPISRSHFERLRALTQISKGNLDHQT